jgi:hypothetical protein
MTIIKRIFWTNTVLLITLPAIVFAQGNPVIIGDPSGQTVDEILNSLVNWLLVIAAPIAIIMTIWAGYLFMTGGDNEERIKKARSTLMYVVIGIVVLIISKGIITLVRSFVS